MKSLGTRLPVYHVLGANILITFIYYRRLVFMRNTHTHTHTHTHKHTHLHTCMYTQGLKNQANMSADVVEAYKYVFSQPGALTAPLNYYRCIFKQPAEERRTSPTAKIDVPVLIIWVSPLISVTLWMSLKCMHQ